MQKAIHGVPKISLEVDIKDVVTSESLRHLAMKPDKPIISFNMEFRKVKSFTT
jgi:hypothetical protein